MEKKQCELTRRELLAGAIQVGIVLAADNTLAFAGVFGGEQPLSLRPQSMEIDSDARPWVYWFWFKGDITREGITHDLEAMHEVGIGGVMIFCTNEGTGPRGHVGYMSPEWVEMTNFCIVEAARLQMQVALNNCAGFTDAGGPWITPERAMHKLTWSQTSVKGGKTISLKLEKPPIVESFYRDIRVLALPAPLGANEQIPEPKIDYVLGKPSSITHDYGTAITARSGVCRLHVNPKVGVVPVDFTLEASDDGITYRTVYHFDNHWRFSARQVNRRCEVDIRFAPATARFFRMVIPYTDRLLEISADGKNHPYPPNAFELFAEAHLALWRLKAGHNDFLGGMLEQPDRYPGGWTNPYHEQGTQVPDPEPSSILPVSAVIDVSVHLKDDDFQWDAPSGDWVLVRIGSTLTGKKIHPVFASDDGLCISMFNKEAMRFHFDQMMSKVADANAAYIGTALSGVHMDSSECGPQNWSPTFATEFEKRRGYSLMPWLPVLAGGRIVGSVDHSERVLFDFRRTIADLIAENWEELGRLAHMRQLRFTGEASGRLQFMNDPLLYLSKTDIPMGEFWPGEPDTRPDCHLSRSAANVHGKKVVMGEAFTSVTWNHYPSAGKWMDHPYILKAFGDMAFCAGVNHYTFHRCISQPRLNEYPGIAWGTPNGVGYGINMDPTNTWWKPGAAWIAYISRCQQMLQAGRCVVDVAVLHTENVPNVLLRPEGLPSGYHFDGLHHRMLSQVKVDNGDLVLPSGMRYRMLVLQPGPMTPETAAEITRLLQGGATVVGAKPMQSPSLTNYPQCDAQLKVSIDAWQNLYPSVLSALRALNLKPDVSGLPASEFLFMHRRSNDEDVYFVSNQTPKEQDVLAGFRVEKCTPRLFYPDSGKEVDIAVFEQKDETIAVPLRLDPSGSLFVIFKRGTSESVIPAEGLGNGLGLALDGVELARTSDRGIDLTTARHGTMSFASSKGHRVSVSLPALPGRVVKRPWRLTFPPNWGAPAEIQLDELISWSDHTDEGVRHFSGSAVYTTTFELSESDLALDRAIFIDLGDVQVIAEVTLNRKPICTLWKPPFRYEVTEAAKPGLNTLSVTVTNLWPNRLIGDSALPEEKRFTKTSFSPFKPDSPLLPSGLLGPVRLIFAHRRKLLWNQ